MEHPITIESNRSINEGLSPMTLDEDTNTENTTKINTEIIKNPINQSDPFELIHDENEIDEMDSVYLYRRLIKENIDYDIMMQKESWQERDMYNELYEIICDVVCIPRKSIRIGGEEYAFELVKSKFLKLKTGHLQYVISCMKENTSKVGNIKAYLTTALYNAPNTMGNYYQSRVNHDMYGV